MISTILTRRRSLAIIAAIGGLAVTAGRKEIPPVVWEGLALGGQARIHLYHPDWRDAMEMITAAVAEIERLERIFSLHRLDSALIQLNRTGVLNAAPLDLRRLLAEAIRFHSLSGGAFDVSVQPLWDLYAAYFADPNADPAGPSSEVIAKALTRVNTAGISADADGSIRFACPGMALTFNGIAQGYITDRVAEVLRAHGMTTALLALGETLALGPREFSIGIANPNAPARALLTVPLGDGEALATSGGYGYRFVAGSACHHLFDPTTGLCARRWSSVSVIAATATTADALSTAFSIMPFEAIAAMLVRAGGHEAIILDMNGHLTRFRATLDHVI